MELFCFIPTNFITTASKVNLIFLLSPFFFKVPFIFFQGSSRHFPLGTQVYFTSVVVRNKKLKKVSPNSTIEQALAVWDTRKPSDLVKLADDDTYLEELEEYRDDFLDLFESDAFIPLSHYRIRGRIIGYLNADFGIIELDGSERFAKVLFHRSQVYLFRRKLSNRNCMLTDLPVGLKITIEATPITQDLGNFKFWRAFRALKFKFLSRNGRSLWCGIHCLLCNRRFLA